MSGCKFDFAVRKGTKPGSNFISQKSNESIENLGGLSDTKYETFEVFSM